MGLDKDLTRAMKIAAREAVAFLTTEKGLSANDAYMLASMAVDFCITQVVDGTLGVHGMIPKNRLGRAMITKLKVYRGAVHPHAAQKPEALAV